MSDLQPDPRLLTLADVTNQQFTTRRLKPGYDETEVDEFLDEVEYTFEQWMRFAERARALSTNLARDITRMDDTRILTEVQQFVDTIPR